MRLVIVSGRSGSGKSTALAVLEDNGFYCIDNLPAGLLPELAERSFGKFEGMFEDGRDAERNSCITALRQKR